MPMRFAVRMTRQAISPRFAIRIFLNILVLKEAAIHGVCDANQEPNSKSAPQDEPAVGILELAAKSLVVTIPIGVRKQIKSYEAEPSEADQSEEQATDGPLHSAASSSGGRLWPSRRSTSSAASARLVPGPKIACTPAARSIA